ncbi:MAG TPA: peptide-N-glycosidase F-related protein [Flavobacteriales bacterium]
MRRLSFLTGLLLSCSLLAQDPVITLRLTDAFPVEMPQLRAYAVYAKADIEEPATITSVTINVDGNELPTELVNGAYEAWWTPTAYGPHTVSVNAVADNGNSADTTVDVEVTDAIADRTVATFDQAVIDWGTLGSQWYTNSYTLPQSVGAYDRIVANFAVSCPSVPGGCDDWDRLAHIEVKAPNGEWVEMIRYITPYGRACNHSIDVTDFASLLQGNVEVRMFIDTWGSGGWKLDLDLTYEAGTPGFLYSTLQTVWRANYNFGDPTNPQPVSTVTVGPGVNAENVGLRLVTTGHGWGNNNTGNAAEFYHAVHHVLVNGESFTQDLWRDCNPNPDGCSPQNGTWQYDRAGWCPGAIALPYEYDLTPLLAQAPFECTYEFQTTYVDQCHPNNPACVSGTTCPDCNDGYNPYYPVSCYLVSRGNNPVSLGIEPTREIAPRLTVAPNPTEGRFTLQLDRDMGRCVVTVHDVSGTTLRTWFFSDEAAMRAHPFDIGKLSAGTYFIKVMGQRTQAVGKVTVQ